MYKVIASGVYEGESFSAETKPEKSRDKARSLMARLVREADEANGYRLPEYGGEDDCEQSIAVNPDCHIYEYNEGTGDYLQWDVVPA